MIPARDRIEKALEIARKATQFNACDACGGPAVSKWDSLGEGYFWLCAERDADHDRDVYCGTLVETLKPTMNPAFAAALLESWLIMDEVLFNISRMGKSEIAAIFNDEAREALAKARAKLERGSE